MTEKSPESISTFRAYPFQTRIPSGRLGSATDHPNHVADVTPNLLITTYLTLTFAELLLSPIGISLVTKVAPPKYKGLMMGVWFVSTALGNKLVSIPGHM